jgi:hypothetical protein
MKTALIGIFGAFSCATLFAQPDLGGLPPIGPHHRVVNTGAGSYIALETGKHYFEFGEWKESDPTISLQANGATALRLPNKILFGQGLAAGVDILTVENQQLHAAPVAIALHDRLDGRTVVLATLRVQPTLPAEIHPPNIIVYPDAYEGLLKNVSVRYVLEKGSIIQCVIFSEDLPDPALFGLIPETTLIEVWSAFDSTVAPQQTEVVVQAETSPVLHALLAEPDLADTTLDFGSLRLIPGKGFPVDAATPNPRPGADLPDSIPVFKRWLHDEQSQRDVLVEQVEYAAA